MGILRRALGHFVELDEKPAARHDSGGGDNSRRSATYMDVLPKPAPALPLSDQDISKFEEHFDKLFEASNLPGPDYFEFSKAMEAMEAAMPQEGERMRAAYTVLKVQGVTKEQLVATAKQYIGIVDADRKELEGQVAAKTATEITPLEQLAHEAQNTLLETEERIRALQASLPTLRAEAEAKANDVTAAKKRLGANIEGYQTACTAMVARIQQDIKTIETTL